MDTAASRNLARERKRKQIPAEVNKRLYSRVMYMFCEKLIKISLCLSTCALIVVLNIIRTNSDLYEFLGYSSRHNHFVSREEHPLFQHMQN